MSFFFDVFCPDGFVLASERMLLRSVNQSEQRESVRKIGENPHYRANKVICGMAVCGDSPERVLMDFNHACAAGDTLRDIARRFAETWTKRFQPQADELCDSAVHLAGFKRILGSDILVPQMWYWTTWIPEDNRMRYFTAGELGTHLQSFSESNPYNNHMCRIFANRLSVPVPSTLEEERNLVMTFFRERGVYSTWNGDPNLWGSALHTAKALEPVMEMTRPSSLEELAEVTSLCLEFLVKISSFLPDPLLSLPPGENPDILLLSHNGPEWYTPSGSEWTLSSAQ